MKSLILTAVVAMGLAAAAEVRPLVRLSFDEGVGQIAADSSGNGLDAKLVNATWEPFGQSGKAIRLGGKDSYLVLPDDARLSALSNATFSVWIKAPRPERAMALFTRGGYARGWSAYLAGAYLGLSCRTGKRGTSTQALCRRRCPFGATPVDPFVHYTIVCRTDAGTAGKTVVSYYLDGKPLAGGGGQAEFPLENALSAEASEPLAFGRCTSVSSGQFEGLVDELSVYDRPLTADEIGALDRSVRNRKDVVAAQQPAVTLKKLDFPPLKRRRLALYEPPSAPWMPRPVRPAEWFEQTARSLGCTLERLDDAAVADPKALSRFDTLILPAAAMPFVCEDSIFRFLASGGTLVTRSAMPGTFKRLADGSFDRFDEKSFLKDHQKGWYAPFLVRENPAPSARRSFDAPLALAEGTPSLTGDLLPAVLEPVKGLRYRPLDNWDKTSASDGGACDGFNWPLSPDCDFPLYRERNGVGADFCVHRFHNLLIDGGTLVQLGDVGAHLLNGADGARVFEAVLRLAESTLPGEHTSAYCNAAKKLHRAWSDFCFLSVDTLADLREAAAVAQERGKDFAPFVADMADVERRFTALEKERIAQVALVFADKEADRTLAATTALLEKVQAATADFTALRTKAARELVGTRPPAKKAVRHRYGTIPSIASFTVPMSLSRLRGRYFDALRRLGSNVVSSNPFPRWCAEDKDVQRAMDGFFRDFKSVYAAGARFSVGGGEINPATAKVKDAPLIVFPTNVVRRQVAENLAAFAWIGTNRQFRIGTTDETGFGYGFWGTGARADFIRRLKARFGTVAAMNARCGTDVASFDAIRLPVRAPTTQSEHALWELWRTCREDKLCEHYETFRSLVREQAPWLDVFTLPSTGSFNSPLYGLDFYRVSQCEDVRAPDGTCCSDDDEWCYADLADDKRFMTGEWGGLYMESPLQNLHGKLWQELAAGSYGFEQHIMSFGSDVRNYLDALDVPTKYGALVSRVVRDARQLDSLVLDGGRAAPEVLILYSQTSRLHDQPWGFGGEKTFSPHKYSVSAYYRLFLGFGHSARVIDEGAVAARPVPAAAVVFVPQATYLSETVQRRLLDYAKAGGRVVTEGAVGAFDPFGRPSRLLLREAKLDGEPSDAPVTATVGRGSVTFLGRDLGLEKDPAFAHEIEKLLRGFGLSERFSVSDPKRMLREWTLDGETYLFLVSREGRAGESWGLGEVEVAVRGDVKLEDYLHGLPVKTRFEKGFTVFKTLAVNGARVFRIVGGKIAPADDRAARERPARYPTSGDQTTATSEVKDVKLPYEGQLFDVTALRNGDATFSLTTVATGNRRDNGETYLTLSCGALRTRRRIENGQTYFFRTPTRTFRVFCRENFQMFPFYSVLRIEEASRVPPPAPPSAVRKGNAVRLGNGLLDLTLDAASGGNLSSLKLCDDRFEQLANGLAHVLSGARPGPFLAHKLEAKVASDDEGASVAFRLPGASQGLSLGQKVFLAADAASVRYDIRIRNEQKEARMFDVRFHPELALGGAADVADVFVVPEKDGVRRQKYRALGAGTRFAPSEDWAAIVDTRERLALVARFDPAEVKTLYVWESADFYTFEFMSDRASVAPGEARHLGFSWSFCRGLTGVDAVCGPVVAHLARRKGEAFLELATDQRTPVTVSYRVFAAGKTDRPLVSGRADVSFELPANLPLAGVGTGAVEIEVGGPSGTRRFAVQ